jgi:hypothetical protein
MKKDRPRVMIIGSGAISTRLAAALLELASRGIEVVQMEELKRPEPPKFDNLVMKVTHTIAPPPNNLKQLRRDQRAREVRVRKMLPKGKGGR